MTLGAFSSFLKEFIIAQDAVAVPGLGEFISRMQPATISDNGFTINPPYRRLEFVSPVPADAEDGQSFVAMYSAKTGIPCETAGQEVNSAVEEIKSILSRESVVELAGLGRLRTLADGGVFFIMDRDAQIFPDGFGLESVSLKNRPSSPLQPVDIPQPVLKARPEPAKQPESPTQSDFAAQPQSPVQPEGFSQPAPATQTEVSTHQESADQSESPAQHDTAIPPEPTAHPKKRLPVGWKIVIWLLVLAALAVAAFIVLMNFFPDVLDRLLYSPQELEIIRNSGI